MPMSVSSARRAAVGALSDAPAARQGRRRRHRLWPPVPRYGSIGLLDTRLNLNARMSFARVVVYGIRSMPE